MGESVSLARFDLPFLGDNLTARVEVQGKFTTKAERDGLKISTRWE